MHARLFSAFFLLAASAAIPATFVGWTGKTGPIAPTDIVNSATRSLALLQTAGHLFTVRSKAHCVSCHHNLLTALAEDQCRQKGIPFADTTRSERVAKTILGLKFAGNINHPDDFLPVKFIPAYALVALHADHYPADDNTEIAVDYLLGQQQPDGSFAAEYGRPPQEGGNAHLAALAIRSIQLYAAPAKSVRVKAAVARTRHWLVDYNSDVQQETAFQLLGLQWCDASADEKTTIATRLLAMQHADGGWSQLNTMPSDAYATGEALYALFESGTLKPGDEAGQKALAWLLKTQDPTGAWIVQTRAYPIQPYFTTHFPPYDENQFISAAGSSWAVLALLDALPDRPATASASMALP
jgi:N-acyl-D-amino-acid deacylase